MSVAIYIHLPAEVWVRIFDYATDDFTDQYALPIMMAESAWFLNVFGDWSLRSPQEAMNTIQRRSFTVKKVPESFLASVIVR